ncbi:DUF3048 domain-containing protein [Paenibacillus sp. CMAA1364]
MNRLQIKHMLLIVLMSLMITSCANVETETKILPIENPTPIVEDNDVVEDIPPIVHTALLTGLPVDVPTNARPIAVMVNNAPAARPQSGLSKADIVYEVLAEGGITRLVAIYQSNTDAVTVGPIRSIRPYLIEIGEMYNGLLVHAGGSPEAYAIIQRQKKEDLDEIGKAGYFFWRDKSRKAPHNLYSDTDKLRAGADKLKYAQEVTIPTYEFRDGNEVISGDEAKKIDITFLQKSYAVTYEYDDTIKKYKRFINHKSHIDLTTNLQLEAANVIVMGADHKVLDDIGRISVDINQGGEALIFQQGRMMKGSWIHRKGDVIRFIHNNIEIPFVPGTTYINIVPNNPSFDSHVKVSNSSSTE